MLVADVANVIESAGEANLITQMDVTVKRTKWVSALLQGAEVQALSRYNNAS